MQFYTKTHQYYCGIDLHAKTMYVCILNQAGDILVHRNIRTDQDRFLSLVGPYRDDLVVCVECMFTWYWIADVCVREHITFVLGHALYMKAIHGGKAKNDKLDSHKIALLLKGGMLPQAYAYPASMRATCDLLRRRMHLSRQRAHLFAHIQNTVHQYNLPTLGVRLGKPTERGGVVEQFPQGDIQAMVKLTKLEGQLVQHAKTAEMQEVEQRRMQLSKRQSYFSKATSPRNSGWNNRPADTARARRWRSSLRNSAKPCM